MTEFISSHVEVKQNSRKLTKFLQNIKIYRKKLHISRKLFEIVEQIA
jgi:hypothetical protein